MANREFDQDQDQQPKRKGRRKPMQTTPDDDEAQGADQMRATRHEERDWVEPLEDARSDAGGDADEDDTSGPEGRA